GRNGSQNPQLQLDQAIAVFEGALRKNADAPDLLPVIDRLLTIANDGKADAELRKAAVFNLAICYEKMNAWDMAASAWKRYLDQDSSSAWAREARERLARANRHSQNRGATSKPGSVEVLLVSSDADSEGMVEGVLPTWLPAMFSDGPS